MEPPNIPNPPPSGFGSWLLLVCAAGLILWSGATVASRMVQSQMEFIGLQSAHSTGMAGR